MTYVRPNKQISLIFNCATPDSVLFASLARQSPHLAMWRPSAKYHEIINYVAMPTCFVDSHI